MPSKFYLYYLRFSVRDLIRQGTGTTFQAISGKQLRAHPVLVPPLPEQHRIVEAIESYLTRLDDAVASLERVRRNLERYHASVLKAAVEGRLVPTEAELVRREGQDYEPASELLKRILIERRKKWIENAGEKARAKAEEKARKAGNPWTHNDNVKTLEKERAKAAKKYKEPAAPDMTNLPDLPEGWCWATLDQLFPLTYRYPTFYGMEHLDEGIPVIRGEHVLEDGTISTDWDSYWFVSSEVSGKFPKTVTDTGDIIMTVRGTVGRVGAVSGSLVGAQVSPNCLRLAPTDMLSSREYLLLWMRSPDAQRAIRGQTSATTINTIKARQLVETPIPLPPDSEQQRIAEFAARSLLTAKLVQENANLNALRPQSLRRSILKWAFEGKLVDQDPNDLPASVLLERIKAERESMQPRKRHRTGKRKSVNTVKHDEQLDLLGGSNT
jgi:type I restriction enzyme S subunit